MDAGYKAGIFLVCLSQFYFEIGSGIYGPSYPSPSYTTHTSAIIIVLGTTAMDTCVFACYSVSVSLPKEFQPVTLTPTNIILLIGDLLVRAVWRALQVSLSSLKSGISG